MPRKDGQHNRVIRDWTDSARVNELSPQAERFLIRLMMKADDFGNYYGHPGVLWSNLFPHLLDQVTVDDVKGWLQECASPGSDTANPKPLVIPFKHDGINYVEIPNFGQNLRHMVHKFPVRGESAADTRRNCGESAANVPTTNGEPSADAPNNGGESSAKVPSFPFRGIRNPESGIRNPESGIRNPEEREENTKIGASASPFEKAMAEFTKMRKQIRKPLTVRGSELILMKLKKLSGGNEETMIAILEQSIMNSWMGIFPLKGEYADRRGFDPKRNSGPDKRPTPLGDTARAGKYDSVERPTVHVS